MTWSPFLSDVTPGPDVDHHAGALVTEDHREQALRIGARAGELVRMADAGRADLDQDLAGLRPVEIDGFHDQRLASGIGDGGTGFHLFPAPSVRRGA